ncbi:hypothetical protein LCGC14_1120070 [marine sediment metagenome]|uniref:Uncharacterized protein n=1 Tax=marine sediment metagenome TaxID=412755 RepID=A0A0F9MS25_9ZZZZ
MADHVHVWEWEDDGETIKLCLVCGQRRTRARIAFMLAMANYVDKEEGEELGVLEESAAVVKIMEETV